MSPIHTSFFFFSDPFFYDVYVYNDIFALPHLYHIRADTRVSRIFCESIEYIGYYVSPFDTSPICYILEIFRMTHQKCIQVETLAFFFWLVMRGETQRKYAFFFDYTSLLFSNICLDFEQFFFLIWCFFLFFFWGITILLLLHVECIKKKNSKKNL